MMYGPRRRYRDFDGMHFPATCSGMTNSNSMPASSLMTRYPGRNASMRTLSQLRTRQENIAITAEMDWMVMRDGRTSGGIRTMAKQHILAKTATGYKRAGRTNKQHYLSADIKGFQTSAGRAWEDFKDDKQRVLKIANEKERNHSHHLMNDARFKINHGRLCDDSLQDAAFRKSFLRRVDDMYAWVGR